MESNGRFGTASAAQAYAIRRSALPAHSAGRAVAGSLLLWQVSRSGEAERPHEPKPLTTSGQSGLATTVAFPAKRRLASISVKERLDEPELRTERVARGAA